MKSLLLFAFPLLMAFAASSDLLTMRISNRLVLAVAATFPVVALAAQLPLDLVLMHAACALLVLAGAFALFAMGWIGGGDAKLAAATALWMGFGLVLPYLVYAALLGGALTVLLLLLRRIPLAPALARHGWVERLHDAGTGIPYGIALAAAGLVVYSQTAVFKVLVT
jgi:prepilin peptidase CpaA